MVMHGDRDTGPAADAGKAAVLEKRGGIVVPMARRAEELKGDADFHMRMKERHLRGSQRADTVTVAGGHTVTRPATWSAPVAGQSPS